MKTTIDIDEELLETAKQVLGTDTIKGTLSARLRSFVRQRQLQDLADSLGKVRLELTPDELRRQRRKRIRRVPR